MTLLSSERPLETGVRAAVRPVRAPRRRRPLLRTFVVTLLATLAAQAAWILVVPPFRGLDEHDHAYRAADVAHGDWTRDHVTAPGAWGGTVAVPIDLVMAAQPICQWLPYTTASNCNPGGTTLNGLVRVSSSASQYNPVFYAVVGTASLPFDGYTSLYAMRIAAALLCALLVAAAATTLRRWSLTPWPMIGMLTALTPTLVYSTAVAAPNGIELCAALAVWCALLGLTRSTDDAALTRKLVLVATVAALPLVTVRSLGPLWLLLVVASCLVLMKGEALRRLVRQRYVWGCAGVVAVATLVALWWTLTAGTNSTAGVPEHYRANMFGVVGSGLLIWTFQSMAAFPARDEFAPMALYALGVTTWWVFAAVALRLGVRRERLALALVVLLSALVPSAVTVLTYSTLGSAWQGRYGYPLALGFWMVCGLVLERRALDRRPGVRTRRWTLIAALTAPAVFLAVQLMGTLHVLLRQLDTSPLAGTGHWVQPSVWLVCVLLAASAALFGGVIFSSRTPPPARSPHPTSV